jgi:hypothetical protein
MTRRRPIVANRRAKVLMPVSGLFLLGFSVFGPTWLGLLCGVLCLVTCAAGLEWR